MDKKDQIILQQLDVIRSMTENNVRRMGSDFWGTPFENVTGDALTYGRVTMAEGDITVTYGNGQALGPVATPYQFADGSYAGVALSSDGSQVCAAVGLKKLENVPNSAWKSAEYVTVGGVTYAVSEDVVCYNRTTGKYVTLSAARAFASAANLYYDRTPDQGGKIRVVEVR